MEENKLIAEFLGISLGKMWGGMSGWIYTDYSNNWNVLMSVIEKIEALDLKESMYSWKEGETTYYNFQEIEVDITNKYCSIDIILSLDPAMNITYNTCDSKLEAVYKSVVEFINWYNTRIK